jgi:hypothetical protein
MRHVARQGPSRSRLACSYCSNDTSDQNTLPSCLFPFLGQLLDVSLVRNFSSLIRSHIIYALNVSMFTLITFVTSRAL